MAVPHRRTSPSRSAPRLRMPVSFTLRLDAPVLHPEARYPPKVSSQGYAPTGPAHTPVLNATAPWQLLGARTGRLARQGLPSGRVLEPGGCSGRVLEPGGCSGRVLGTSHLGEVPEEPGLVVGDGAHERDHEAPRPPHLRVPRPPVHVLPKNPKVLLVHANTVLNRLHPPESSLSGRQST